MNPRFVLTALLLFGAAIGWVYSPPPLVSDRQTAHLAVQQVRDNGSVWQQLQSQDRLRRWRDRTIPIGCVLLGIGALLAGMMHKPTQTELNHEHH